MRWERKLALCLLLPAINLLLLLLLASRTASSVACQLVASQRHFMTFPIAIDLPSSRSVKRPSCIVLS